MIVFPSGVVERTSRFFAAENKTAEISSISQRCPRAVRYHRTGHMPATLKRGELSEIFLVP
jgi:hypothetical protein